MESARARAPFPDGAATIVTTVTVRHNAAAPYIDPSAQVASSATIGAGTKVWAFTRVQNDAVVGTRCQLGQNVYIDRGVYVGNRVKVQNNVSIYTGVEIGDGVFLGPSCVFTNVMLPRAVVERKTEFAVTRVGRGATIGANATVVCGVNVGPFALVGAGAVVSRDVAAFSLVVGNPARHLGWVCACGERIAVDTSSYRCGRCALVYDVRRDGCRPLDTDAFERWWTERLQA